MTETNNNMCTFQKIHTLDKDICEYVDTFCQDEQLVKFSYFYFCQVSQNIIVLDLLTILVPIIAFRLLSTTSEKYLSPALAKLSKFFRLTQTVAGVTLLAFGNGAPDVITAIVAGNSSDDAISIAIGSIFGAGLFVTTITLAAVVSNGSKIQIQKGIFIRDVLFYLLGCVLILIFILSDQVNLIMASIFVSVYLIYNKEEEKQVQKMDTVQKIDEVQIEIQLEQIRKQSTSFEQRPTTCGIVLSQDQNNLDNNLENKSFIIDTQQQQQEASEDLKHQEISLKIEETLAETKSKQSSEKQNQSLSEKQDNFIRDFEQMSVFQKIFYFFEIPINILRYLTIPPADDEQWNKYRAILCCFTSPIAFLILIGKIDLEVGQIEGFYLAYLLLGISLFASVLVLFFSNTKEAPNFLWIFSITAFVVSVAYISIVAQILIDFINFFGILTSINRTFLGMTLLACGNSSTDFFTNSQLAKKGYGVMALTGCFAGQIFNLFIGFGFTLILKTKKQSFNFSLLEANSINGWINNSIAITVLILTIIITLITLFASYQFNYQFEKGKYSAFLKMYYLFAISLCLILCIADQFNK